MFKNSLGVNADHAVEMYVSGKSCRDIAQAFAASPGYIHKLLTSKGVTFRSSRSKLPEAEIVRLYRSGVSEKALSDRFGCSRTPIRRILVASGVQIRGRSEAESVKWSQMTETQRRAQVAAANQAVRNAPPEFHKANSIKQALTKSKTLSKVGHLESEFQAAFEIRGFNPIPQHPFGAYNIDLAIGNAAIEIHGNTANPHSHPYYRKRVMKLLEGGWNVIYIKTIGQISIHGAADQVTRMINHAEWNESPVCQYGVIRGSGELVATGRLNGDQLAIVNGPDGFFA